MKKHRREFPAIVYLVTNRVNGKRYIGVTTHELKLRMSQHFSAARHGRGDGAFYRAIRKYGEDVFEYTILSHCATGEQGLQEEVRLIAALKPEYNSTAGGDGNVGRKMSLAGRRRLSEFHRGKKWHQGHKHSEETKAALREAQLKPEIIAAWSERAKSGPMKQARPVKCLDDNLTYPSAAAAARAYRVDNGALVEVCLGKRGRKTIGGHRFTYMEAL